MTAAAERFPFVVVDPSLGPSHALPYVPIVLEYGQRQIILGQANFFMEFDVCLFRSRWTFELRPKTA